MYYHLMTLPKNGPKKNGTVHAHHLLERMLNDLLEKHFTLFNYLLQASEEMTLNEMSTRS